MKALTCFIESLTISDYLSFLALIVSLFVFLRDVLRNRFNLRITGDSVPEGLISLYYFPQTDMSHGSTCSFIATLLLENQSASPLCISTVKIKANRYPIEIPAAFNSSSINRHITYDTFEGYSTVNLSETTSLPLMLKPYEAQMVTLYFPEASDNYIPVDFFPSTENTCIPYTLFFYASNGRKKKLTGNALVGSLKVPTPPKPSETAFG